MAAMRLSNGFEMNVEVHKGLVASDTLLIHGNLASNNWWRPAVDQWLVKASRETAEPLRGRLILAEWRGCGASAPPRSRAELHPAHLADDYIKLLLELGVRKASVVGHSAGGLIALFALLKAPDLFDRVVLLSSVGAKGVKFDEVKYQALTKMSENRAYCAAILGSTIHGNDFANPLFGELVDDAFKTAKDVWHGMPDALGRIDITGQLAQIHHPALVLHGEFDNVIPKEDALFLAENLGRARFHELKGQGHSINIENPALFVRTVDDFLFQA